MKITEALNTIYKQSKSSGLQPELMKELKKEINVVAKFTNSSTQDAFVFAIVCSMNLFGENVESHDLLRFFDVTPFELMDYLKSLNTLSDRSILIKRKNRRRFEDALRKYHYVVNPKILDAIISEEPYGYIKFCQAIAFANDDSGCIPVPNSGVTRQVSTHHAVC